VCASHFCPVGQSAFAPQTWHVPLTQTCPVVLVAQSLFDWQPPALGPSAPPAPSFVAASPPPVPVEASSPEPDPTTGDPELAQPDGKKKTVAISDKRAKEAWKRRSRSI
jgi:hypothetical protein